VAGIVYGIVHGGEGARLQQVNANRKLLDVVGKVLCDPWTYIKANDKRLVILLPESLVEKRDGRFLFKREAFTHRLTGIYEQSDLHGKIRLAAEAEDLFGRLTIIQNLKILLFQVPDVVAVFVCDGEDQVNFAHGSA